MPTIFFAGKVVIVIDKVRTDTIIKSRCVNVTAFLFKYLLSYVKLQQRENQLRVIFFEGCMATCLQSQKDQRKMGVDKKRARTADADGGRGRRTRTADAFFSTIDNMVIIIIIIY